MKLTFEIEYYISEPGQYLAVFGNLPTPGRDTTAGGIRMTDTGDGLHRLEIEVSAAKESISYRYAVCADGKVVRAEWGPDRMVKLDSHLQSALIVDHWKDIPIDKPFYSTLMTDCVFRRADSGHVHSLKPSMLQLEVEAAMVPRDATLAIIGSEPEIGAWNPDQAILLTSTGMPYWKVQLPLDALVGRHAEYKFILLSEETGEVIAWERGPNRTLAIPECFEDEAMIVSGLHFNNPLPLWHGAGTAIPVFSLRSDDDFGVGDFYDLMLMVDWAAETGQSVVQILPINDTTMTHTWRDCYPYNANSCFALHPMYLRLNEMGSLDDPSEAARFEQLRQELNALLTVDYERVNRAKNEFTRRLFSIHGKDDLATAEFQTFYKANIHWLKPYAAYCTLRDQYSTANMADWGEWSVYSPSRVDRLMRRMPEEFNYVFYLQFHLDRQLRQVRDYAHSKGVAIKGDIPIGISRTSVDAWTMPELFNLDCSAGAPPDDFSVLGQNWGFPTYRWDRMARDGFLWWRRRFEKMAEYFDAYRIDHVLGFFRIWKIPSSAIHGLLGTFYSALPLSPDEMLDRYGFRFDREKMTRPYATEETLRNLFGDMTETVKERYLSPDPSGIYLLRPIVDTQMKAVDEANRRSDLTSAERERLCQGLLTLHDYVLFIADHDQPDLYHPRIAGFSTPQFEALDFEQQQAFRHLHEDFFYHRNDELWRQKAMEKLPPLIDATRMLCCAEDLGMIPRCVPEVMDQLRILSLEIQRMPKTFDQFADPARYPYLSVCSTSTHDMSGVRGWWEEDADRSRNFFYNRLNGSGQAPTTATTEICGEILKDNLHAPSMLCIFPLQDWLSIDSKLRRDNPADEQINDPSNSAHYWRYRLHLPLETLLKATDFNNQVRSMISAAGR